jgi:twitching motility two-component system response regulator PilG
MVIDDSNTVLRAAETALRGSGYEVLTANDGFAAMSEITDHKPDLIFIDIVMPRLDGYQACSLIKRNRHFRDTPIVMLSSKDGLFDRARGRIVGAEAHINKPFSKADLLSAVERYAKNGKTKMAVIEFSNIEPIKQTDVQEQTYTEDAYVIEEDDYPCVNGLDMDSSGQEIDTESFKSN